MKTRRVLLLVDSAVNLILGCLLISYSPDLAGFLGVPVIDSAFYPNILGGVLTGIALALLIEVYRGKKEHVAGLGLMGAILINLCGGTVLLFWLIMGKLDLPWYGGIFLWSLCLVLIGLSSIELFNYLQAKPGSRDKY